MSNPRPIRPYMVKPGYTRDQTMLASDTYIDGQWVRFDGMQPEKMGGYREMSANNGAIIRGSFVFSKDQLVFIYGFGENKCFLSLTSNESLSCVASSDILDDLALGDYNYQVDSIFDSTGEGVNYLLAHPQKNLVDITDSTNHKIYYTQIGSNPPVFDFVHDGLNNPIEVSGGIVVLQPYVFAYGNDGLIRNNNQNKINDWEVAVGKDANEVNVAYTKIVKGLPVRGGGNSPAGLFWSLNSLIRVSYVGGASIFKYDIISAQTSILSPNAVVEYDGAFFWPGVDRFFGFAGTVKELPNPFNGSWFFNNLNYAQRTKVWAMKIPRFGEIWWFFPMGDSVECNAAIIYNVKDGTWYDTRCPRSSGFFSQVFRYPVMFDSQPNSTEAYSLLAHEIGNDAVQGGQVLAIPSYVESNDLGMPGAGQDYWTRITRLEPDFLLEGDLRLQIIGREFANSPDNISEEYVISSDTDRVDIREQHRHMRFRFTSNQAGGYFKFGKVLLHTEPGDIRS